MGLVLLHILVVFYWNKGYNEENDTWEEYSMGNNNNILEEIGKSVEKGHYKTTEELLTKALKQHIPALEILEKGLVPAMRQMGEHYKNNEADIPRILASARCMRKGLDLLSPNLETERRLYVGTVVLGTVEGDLHDVGKNLVAIMFRSAGFKVIDLGVDISEKQFIKAVRQNPDVSIVCLSSLLTTACSSMQHTVKAIRQSDTKHRLKIMVGGGAVTKEFAEQIGADGYSESAVDAAELAKTFIL